MKVKDAREAAKMWVMEHASHKEGFKGAYFSGSSVHMPEDAELPAASDIDVMVITSETEPPLKLGKFTYQGVLLEITFLSWSQFANAEDILSSYHLAGSFRTDTVIADPTGRLRQLQRQISPRFADRYWVRRRCADAMHKIQRGLQSLDASAPLSDQVLSWLFPTGITTHVVLAAALRNPTIRLRYLAAREVLNDYSYDAFYEELLELLGCKRLTPQRLEQHLAALDATFDAAAAVSATPFLFSSDITQAAKPIAIDGSRELIENGNHFEAVFWIVATYARCHKILVADEPSLHERHKPAFEAVLADLGIISSLDFRRRADEVLAFLPKLESMAETLMKANPDITDVTDKRI
ncbi:hypothetical protein [Paenibacillus thalictri]|uniref:Polymerase nucleotidyl transferase domain-containing protein n=1 Tax=Paenibacillus thalictri TaxID=2527873 RepID=A0A4Q9DJN2_9BACL|nr:hypothetical protein [Paenibacillus thalictri]TBL74607.1 hypothetical protein EYB31_25140 [Paenibacillus thalictri]